MTQADNVPCQFIIGHPEQAKFLTIKHSDSWALPKLKMPQGRVDYKARLMTQRVKLKYGLDTRVVRPLVSTPLYHCFELELVSKGSSKNLQAVWVDREQYLQFRNKRMVDFDPFDDWLTEREKAVVPEFRPQWQIPGWTGKANHWIQFQLDKLSIQTTGTVQQFRVGWTASCLLRVLTSEGLVYFKAGYLKPPYEAAVTALLAQKWPEHVNPPLAVNSAQNWMLNHNFRAEGEGPPGADLFAQFVRALGRIQLGSVDCMDELVALDCPLHNLDYLLDQIENRQALIPLLKIGEQPLSESELQKFMQWLPGLAADCNELKELAIPDMLIHTDFRDDNMVLQDDCHRILDWADVVIGHPFFSLEKVLSHRLRSTGESKGRYSDETISDELKDSICTAYLESFVQFAPMEKLQQALLLTQKLFPLWRFCIRKYELNWVEKGGTGHRMLAVQMQDAVRTMLGIPIAQRPRN
jgi:hypothetical protein